MIKKLIANNYSSSKEFNEIMAESVTLRELNKYLDNLDRLTIINERGNDENDNAIQIDILKAQGRLHTTLISKISKIINNNSHDINKVKFEAEQLQELLSEDIDIVGLKSSESNALYKRYLVAYLISDCIKMLKSKQVGIKL